MFSILQNVYYEPKYSTYSQNIYEPLTSEEWKNTMNVEIQILEKS